MNINLTTWKIISGIIILLISFIDCWKYLWQAAKVRRIKNSKTISRKFYIESFTAHIIIATIFATWKEWFLVTVFIVGCFTTGIMVITCWRYYPKKERGSVWYYLKDSFKGGWF